MAPAAARSSPGTSRSAGRSEEEDVFVGAIRPCRARESKPQISSPLSPNTVATTTARSSNRSGHDSTNANEGSPPLVFGIGFDNFDGSLPSDLINERFFRSSSRKSPSAGFYKWPHGVIFGYGLGPVACASWRAHQANTWAYSLTTGASFMRSFFEWRKVFLQNPS